MNTMTKTLVIAGMGCLMILGISQFFDKKPVQAEDALTKADVQEIIESYLKENPGIVMEALNEYQRQEQVKQLERAKMALESSKEILYHSKTSPVAGNKDGEKVIVEFFDYNCGYCKRAISDINKIIENHDDVRVVFKEMPILSAQSEVASKMALAVDKQGKYFEFHRALMEANGKLDEKRMETIAAGLGVDVEKMKKDMNGSDIAKEIADVRKLAQDLGIRGTPAFVVNGELVRGAVGYDQIKATLEK